MEIHRGAVALQGAGSEEANDAGERTLDGGAVGERAETDITAAVGDGPEDVLAAMGARGLPAVGVAERRAADGEGAAGSSIGMDVAAETSSCHACTLPPGYVYVFLNQRLAASWL